MSARSGPRPPSPQEIVADVDATKRGPVPRCDVCGVAIEGEPAGRGLLVWTRGEEVRREEPSLCEACAPAITAAGGLMWLDEEGDE